jgi:hypothetical protein
LAGRSFKQDAPLFSTRSSREDSMTTYYVAYTNGDGENLDLFVFADTPDQVPAAWNAYYELSAVFDGITPIRPKDDDNALRIFECPQSRDTTAVAVNWDHINEWWVTITDWEED